MRTYEFVTVDVFTERRFGGNPLAVFPKADGLDDATMQAIAGEFNLSETTFVLPPTDPRHDACVRIFTPKTELPFAGHPNVGTAFVLGRSTTAAVRRLRFEERAGVVEAELLRGPESDVTGARIAAPQPLSLGTTIPRQVIAACAGIDVTAVVGTRHDPVVASVGTPFVFAELSEVSDLVKAVPQIEAFRDAARHLPGMDLQFALHLYVRTATPGVIRARMFAPLAGVGEDPATGSAAAALAGLLLSLDGGDEQSYLIDQGSEMGRPSRMRAEASRQSPGSVVASVSGTCVPMLRGALDV